jgi:WD40 repeat protein
VPRQVHDLDRYEEEGNGVLDVDHFGQAVSAVAISPDGARFAAGGDDRLVALFTMEDNEFERNVTRFPLPVRDLKFDNEGKFLAVASDDAEIRLVDVADPENMKTLEGHDGGVKSLAFCPTHPLLASSGADRTVRFWDLEDNTEKGKVVQCFSKEAAAAIVEGVPVNLCGIDWSADGKILAVAGGLDVKAVSRETLTEVSFSTPWGELAEGRNSLAVRCTLHGDPRLLRVSLLAVVCSLVTHGPIFQTEGFKGGHMKNVSVVKFSKNGLYLMSIDVDGVIVVWDVENRESIRRCVPTLSPSPVSLLKLTMHLCSVQL